MKEKEKMMEEEFKEHYKERYHRFFEMAKAGRSKNFEYDVYTDHRVSFDDVPGNFAHFHAVIDEGARRFEARIVIPTARPVSLLDIRFHSYVTPPSKRKGKFSVEDQREIYKWLVSKDKIEPEKENWQTLIHTWNRQNPDDVIKIKK